MDKVSAYVDVARRANWDAVRHAKGQSLHDQARATVAHMMRNRYMELARDAAVERTNAVTEQMLARVQQLEEKMYQHARDLEVEQAAKLRAEINGGTA